jgi:hypothetical protein
MLRGPQHAHIVGLMLAQFSVDSTKSRVDKGTTTSSTLLAKLSCSLFCLQFDLVDSLAAVKAATAMHDSRRAKVLTIS